jgi:hypothetical protein
MTLARPVSPATTALEDAPLLSLVHRGPTRQLMGSRPCLVVRAAPLVTSTLSLGVLTAVPAPWVTHARPAPALLKCVPKAPTARASPHLARSVPMGPIPIVWDKRNVTNAQQAMLAKTKAPTQWCVLRVAMPQSVQWSAQVVTQVTSALPLVGPLGCVLMGPTHFPTGHIALFALLVTVV